MLLFCHTDTPNTPVPVSNRLAGGASSVVLVKGNAPSTGQSRATQKYLENKTGVCSIKANIRSAVPLSTLY